MFITCPGDTVTFPQLLTAQIDRSRIDRKLAAQEDTPTPMKMGFGASAWIWIAVIAVGYWYATKKKKKKGRR